MSSPRRCKSSAGCGHSPGLAVHGGWCCPRATLGPFSLLSTRWLLHPAPTDRFPKMLIAPNRSARSIASREVEETPLSFDNSDNWRKFELVWQQVHNQPLFLKLLQSIYFEYFHHRGLVKNCVATIVIKQCEVLPTRPNKWMTCSGQRFYCCLACCYVGVLKKLFGQQST